MDECNHPHLTHVVNLEFSGDQSTTYECQECKQLLTVVITPLKKMGVSYGPPGQLNPITGQGS